MSDTYSIARGARATSLTRKTTRALDKEEEEEGRRGLDMLMKTSSLKNLFIYRENSVIQAITKK